MTKCSQCDSVTINGVFCHETGCPEARKHQCEGCDNPSGKVTKNFIFGFWYCEACNEATFEDSEVL